MTGLNRSSLYPSLLLALIFGGAIVGETVALSLIITSAGSTVISRLYLVNGLLLFGLPVIFFNYIDRVNRARLLSKLLLIIAGLLVVFFGMFEFSVNRYPAIGSGLLILLYPLAYLSKTILFLTFWTLANDIFDTGESKKTFPVIAAWGLGGGIAGSCIARLLVEIASAEKMILLWASLYAMAWFFARKTGGLYSIRLRKREESPQFVKGLVGGAASVMTMRLVRLMSALYFMIFIVVFSFDFLFWNRCHLWFTTSGTLASFQFSFYLAHGIITIAVLWLVLPWLISRLGFTRLFYVFPLVLLAGSCALIGIQMIPSGMPVFASFVIVQFLRHVSFENAFSPIYQMFFAAVEKEKRGRARMILDGVAKPGAILISGLLIMLLRHNQPAILVLVAASSACLVAIVYELRKTFARSLIPGMMARVEPEEIIVEAGAQQSHKMAQLIRQYALSESADLRSLAVSMLAEFGTKEAMAQIAAMFERERDAGIREKIARSLGNFFWYQSRPFLENLLNDSDQRIRANALRSLNEMNCNWKRHLKPQIKPMLFEKSLRVQIETARFLWNTGEQSEKENVRAFLDNLLQSANPNRRSAGLYLTGQIRPDGWENILIENLSSASIQVFTKSVEVIFCSASHKVKVETLHLLEILDKIHIGIAGRILEENAIALEKPFAHFMVRAKNRRMINRVVRCLRIIADEARSSERKWLLAPDIAKAIRLWIMEELAGVYRDAFVRHNSQSSLEKTLPDRILAILDDALREEMLRVCEWAVNAMVLIDRDGILVWRHNDIDIKEHIQRNDLIEIIAGTGDHGIGSLILPILKALSWEQLAKTGRTYFRDSAQDTCLGLLYFIKSDGVWTRLCALYAFSHLPVHDPAMVQARKQLMELASDRSALVAEAAKGLLGTDSQQAQKGKIEAFVLLERVLFMKQSPMLKSVPAEKLMLIAEISEEVLYDKGAVISTQGEVSDHLYLVKTGLLRIIRTDKDIEAELARSGPGEMYGEIGLFSQAPRSATAIAEERSELLVIRREALKKLLLETPEIGFHFLEAFSDRLRGSGEEIAELRRRLKDSQIANVVKA